MFHVNDPALIGRPENPPAFPVEYVFEVGGQTLVVSDEPVAATESAKPAVRRRLDVDSAGLASLRVRSVQLFAPGAARPVTVELTAARARAAGTVQLEAPAGWRSPPPHSDFDWRSRGERARFTFTVTAPPEPATASARRRSAEINGARFNNQRVEIRYDHIPFQLLQPRGHHESGGARAGHSRPSGRLPAWRGRRRGGQPRSRWAMRSRPLTGADLTPDTLRDLRCGGHRHPGLQYPERSRRALPALFAYVEGGGNLIAQYNQSDGLDPNWLAPFRLRISRDRVTDEDAPVTVLAPDHPALTTPNRITAADFDGWVQERGLYFPDQWDERFTAILASRRSRRDAASGRPARGPAWQGYFVYTGLAWFRQLPEGVPGAYRLFANLVSLGK